ncbi:MAG: DUF3426 domain-containing protein [Rubrivivax sp.]|nr:DUF3426 domain-containing protein [Rubrivivax sp.]
MSATASASAAPAPPPAEPGLAEPAQAEDAPAHGADADEGVVVDTDIAAAEPRERTAPSEVASDIGVVVEDRPAAGADTPALPAAAVSALDAALPGDAASPAMQLDLPLDGDVPPGDIRTDAADMPSFVRKAERAARWRSPRVRAALAAGCLVALTALAVQWTLAQRDLVGARSASLRPMLLAACEALGCEVRAPRSLQALRVEASGVVRVERGDHYRLSVSLRNLGTHEVALPAFELALTDTQGRLIARRVLRASELGARAEALGAGAELTLQSTIQVASGTVAGYTIELFYP